MSFNTTPIDFGEFVHKKLTVCARSKRRLRDRSWELFRTSLIL